MKYFRPATNRLFRALKRRGIATVRLAWRMREGMGEVYYIRAFDRAGRHVSVAEPITIALHPSHPRTRYCSLKEALDDCAWTLLEHCRREPCKLFKHAAIAFDARCFSIIAIAKTGEEIPL